MRAFRCWLVVISLSASGCSTLSKDECITADWRTIGFEDGSRGYTSQRISSHRESCAEHGITPNMDRYLSGHREGLHNYCTYANGLNVGKRGTEYNQVCPQEIEGEFIAGYRQGRKIHDVSTQIADLENERQSIIQEIDQFNAEITSKREMVIAQSTGPTLRRELLSQIEALEAAVATRSESLDHLTHKQTRYRLRLKNLNLGTKY